MLLCQGHDSHRRPRNPRNEALFRPYAADHVWLRSLDGQNEEHVSDQCGDSPLRSNTTYSLGSRTSQSSTVDSRTTTVDSAFVSEVRV